MTQADIVHPTPVQVKPAEGSRLEQLHALYEGVKAKADAAAAELKTVTDAIKVELTTLAPDKARIQLIGSAGPALGLTHTVTRRFDTATFKRDNPGMYGDYLKESGSWRLAPVKGGDDQ